MKGLISKTMGIVALATVLGVPACAQVVQDPIRDQICIPPTNTDPYSDDFNTYIINNELFGATLGIAGTVAYGACFENMSNAIQGRFGFTIGTTGSIQDNLRGAPLDDNMRLNFGMPISPGMNWGYAMFVDQTGAKTRFGSSEFTLAFIGASDRYMFVRTDVGATEVQLQIDIIGDAARMAWKLRSTGDAPVQRALWVGQWVTMLTENYASRPAKFVTTAGRRPLTLNEKWGQTGAVLTNPGVTVPTVVNFGFSQAQPYGLQILNGPNETTADSNGLNSEQSPVVGLSIGLADFLLGRRDQGDGTLPDVLLPDIQFARLDDPETGNVGETAFVQKFELKSIQTADDLSEVANPQFVAYYRGTTMVSNYAKPYSVAIDTPNLIQTAADNPQTFEQNPATIRVYVDNTRGFSTIDREVPLNDVKITLTLPEGAFAYNPTEADPLNPVNPQRTLVKYINRVNPRQIEHEDFQVAFSPNLTGQIDYQVKIEPASPVVTKTLTGQLTVASQPRVLIRGSEGGLTGANLISLPWNFATSDWEQILQMGLDVDFRAFTFDPQLQQYIVQSSPQRMRGTWIVSRRELGFQQLGGNPQLPTDLRTGAPQLLLRSGWNLIGNPYNFSFPLGQTIGVTGLDGNQAYTFAELVSQGVVSGQLQYWDADTQTYKGIGLEDRMEPNRGYWVYVFTPQDLALSFPPVFEPFLRSSTKSAWVQNDKQWRLQLSARGEKAVDDSNFVGVVPDAKVAQRFAAVKPPMAPIDGAVTLSVRKADASDGRAMSADYATKSGKQEWNVDVFSKAAGNVTVTWPNLSTLPKNVRLRMIDSATGVSRDLRRTSGYTFTADKANTTRSLKITAEPGTVAAAKIGNVVVGRASRDANSPVSISYVLTGDATTTVRILRNDGREVTTITRGRAESAGSGNATWNLRDGANRAVPPGTYKVEIIAESGEGERVRRIVPIVIIR